MGKIKNMLSSLSIRKSLSILFLVMVCCIGMLSGIAIFFANTTQQNILEQRNWVIPASILHEGDKAGTLQGTIQNDSIRREPLMGRQKFAYYACYLAMIGLPILFVISGIIIASRIFYRLKLRRPIEELQRAIEQIEQNDLEHSIHSTSCDELGTLCSSMEKMRTELRQSNKTMWELLEQRKTLNASIAHDLRTPMTILQGYLDYLKKNIPQEKLTKEEIIETIFSMQEAVGRLERYVDCVRDMETIETIQAQ